MSNAILNLNPSIFLSPSAGKAGKLYSQVPTDRTGDFTVTRNGTATYFDKDGILKTAQPNEPRFDFDPVTGEFKGILVEPSATNLLLRSEEFENSYWGKVGITVSPNTHLAPNGTLTADSIFENDSLQEHRTNRNIGAVSENTSYFFSTYVKANGRSRIMLNWFSIGTPERSVTFDLQNVTVSAPDSFIVPLQNEWYRVGMRINVVQSATNCFIAHYSVNDTNQSSYVGDPTKGVLLWGTQIEVGTIATSYIPTQGSQVTRPADIIQRTNAQDLIGQTEGSVYLEVPKNIPFLINERFFSIGNGVANERISLIKQSVSSLRYQIRFGGLTFIRDFSFNYLIDNKILLRYKYGDFMDVYLNGIFISSLPLTSNKALIYGFIAIGKNEVLNSADQMFNHQIKNFTLFKTALSDAEAIALTTL